MPLLDVHDGDSIASDIAAAIAAGWTDIEIPSGTFTVNQPTIDVDGITIRGQGAATTLRRGTLGRTILVSPGVDGFTLRDLRLDMRSVVDFAVGVDLSGTLNATVRDCHLFTDDLPAGVGAPTNMVVYAKGSQGLRVHDCTGYQTQIKINGTSRDAEIRDCVLIDSHNFAVSAVTRNESDYIEDIRILRVASLRGYAGGIFVGVDGDSFRGSHKRLVVQDCTVTMAHDHPTQTLGIIVRAGDLTEDVYVIGNTVSIDPQGVLTDVFGLMIKSQDVAGTLKRCTVQGNDVDMTGGDGYALFVQPYDATDVRVVDNTATSMLAKARHDATVHLGGNVVSGNFLRETSAGATLRISYEGNTLASSSDAHQGTYSVIPVPVPVVLGATTPSAEEQARIIRAAATATVSAGAGTAEITS